MKPISMLSNRRNQLLLLLIISFGLNFNTLFNQYVLDDYVVMTDNIYVEKGIKGIPDIFSNDLMSGSISKENLLSQPRYRPFALVIFALEHQFFGENPFVSHLINVLFFMLLIALLFKLLNTYIFFRQHDNLAFITCLLFAVHPIHSEVIANVKSRDELITLILLIISLMYFIKYFKTHKLLQFTAGLLCFFLALLTRESAITFIGIVPLILYFFYSQPIKKIYFIILSLITVTAGYLVIRFMVIGFHKPVVTDVLNAPYLYATSLQAFATKIYVVFKYLLLITFPFSLSYDYSYNQIPYIEIDSATFAASAIVLIVLAVYALLKFKTKSIYAFSILYFFITISLVANFILDIGTPFSERLMFQPSLAICIVIASLYLRFYKKNKLASVLILSCILILFSLKTIARNSVWKNNEALIITDVISSPNSGRTTLNAAEIYRFKAENESDEDLKNKYLLKAINYGKESLKINPRYAATYISLGFAYFDQYDYNNAADLFIQGYKLDTTSSVAKNAMDVLSMIFYKQGNGLSDTGDIDRAIKFYLRSIDLKNDNAGALYNLGKNYFLKNDTINAMKAWERVKILDPNHAYILK